MQKSLYEDYRELEETHWWFTGRQKIIAELLQSKLIPRHVERALDIGCGTGFLTALVAKIADGVWCVEMADEMIEMLKRKINNVHITKGFWPDVVVDQTFALVTLFDSLEHIEDERGALKKVESVLAPGGIVMITVPAFQFLWSEHDVVNQHKRRYTKETMRAAISESTDLTIIRISYFSFFFFIPIAIVRLAKNALGIKTNGSDLGAMPKTLNNIMAWIFGLEKFLLRYIDLPFGTSLLCVAQKDSLPGQTIGATPQ